MSWAEIKIALNGSLGYANFKPLDKIIEYERYELQYQLWEPPTDKDYKHRGRSRTFDIQTVQNSSHDNGIIVLPNGIQEILNGGRGEAGYLREIWLPPTLKRIGSRAFADELIPRVLTGTDAPLVLYDSLEQIDAGAFDDSDAYSMWLPSRSRFNVVFMGSSQRWSRILGNSAPDWSKIGNGAATHYLRVTFSDGSHLDYRYVHGQTKEL